jgi:DNA-binding IclR family transcriptional regulator
MAMSAPGLLYGLKILALVEQEGAIGFNQLKTDLGLGASSLTRFLNLLIEEKYILKSPEQKYVLGESWQPNPKKLNSTQEQLRSLIYPLLETIARETHFTALYIEFEHGKMSCKEKVIQPHGVNMQGVGSIRTDYLLHPWGYLLLADYSIKQRAFMMEHSKLDLAGVIAFPSLSEQTDYYQMAVDEQYVDDYNRIYCGVRRLAIPIRLNNRLVGSIGLGAISGNVDEDKINDYVGTVKLRIGKLCLSVESEV